MGPKDTHTHEPENVTASCVRVSPSYSTIRYGILRATPGSWRCKLYCRGAKCKYCSWKPWSPKQQAIQGLYSSWITEKIMAMSRPTAKTFTDDNLVAQFHRANICTVINLQMLGEHESCGPQLLPSGFTYNPEILMQNGIQFYNFFWPDFGVARIEMLLNIVKVIHYALKQGKVAVHCHAGLGRTGVVIAAYMVWANHCTYAEAINCVRMARPKSVQSKKQIKLVKDFWKFLEEKGAALPLPGTVHFSDYIHMQMKVLCNSQARKYHHIPKVLHAIMEELLLDVHGELNGRTRLWSANVLKCTSQNDHLFLGKWPARLPIPSKMKSQETDICISGVMENRYETFDSNDPSAKSVKGALTMNNCTKFVQTHLRSNMLLLWQKLDQLMNSFIKPIIPKNQIPGIPERNGEHEDWQCLHRYLLVTMSSLSSGSYKKIAMLITRWYLGSCTSGDNDVVIALQNQLQRA